MNTNTQNFSPITFAPNLSPLRLDRASLPFQHGATVIPSVLVDDQKAREWRVATVFRIPVIDDITLSDTASYRATTNDIEALMAQVRLAAANGLPNRKSAALNAFPPRQGFLEAGGEAVRKWDALIPSAHALQYLYQPEKIERESDVKELSTQQVRDFFRYCLDGRGIRSRSVALTWYINTVATIGQSLTYGSFACGTAFPVITALAKLQQRGCAVHATFIDNDAKALQVVRELTDRHGIHGKLHVENILRNKIFSELREQFDIVDIVGFLEYLKEKEQQHSASRFLKNALSTLKPGGTLILGNMLSTHEQLDFTLYVIGWPQIVPRSVEAVLSICERAGVKREQIEILLPNDGAYALYAIKKESE